MMTKLESLDASATPVSPLAAGTMSTRPTPPTGSRNKEYLTRAMCEDDFSSLFVTGSLEGAASFLLYGLLQGCFSEVKRKTRV